jgi:Uma2 family endonuclease
VAPFDVRLPEENEKDEDIKTVVQPDIALVCNHSKLDERGCKGAPDLVIEIVSPSTVKKDLKDKFLLYEKAGVKEYWIVHPVDKTVMVFTLEEKKYGRPEIYSEEDQVKARVLDDLIVNLKEAFKD